MDRFQNIIKHKEYKKAYKKLEDIEQDRIFCLHDMEHFLSVARLCYIFVLEANMEVSKDIIYGTALLHDIGRAYDTDWNMSHEEASVKMAEDILPDCGYEEEEIKLIKMTILAHRKKDDGDGFVSLFYKADKMTRDCITCKARSQCYWPDDKKNQSYMY